jgi:hypothetical protein
LGRIFRTFLAGVLALLPIAVTVFVTAWVAALAADECLCVDGRDAAHVHAGGLSQASPRQAQAEQEAYVANLKCSTSPSLTT